MDDTPRCYLAKAFYILFRISHPQRNSTEPAEFIMLRYPSFRMDQYLLCRCPTVAFQFSIRLSYDQLVLYAFATVAHYFACYLSSVSSAKLRYSIPRERELIDRQR